MWRVLSCMCVCVRVCVRRENHTNEKRIMQALCTNTYTPHIHSCTLTCHTRQRVPSLTHEKRRGGIVRANVAHRLVTVEVNRVYTIVAYQRGRCWGDGAVKARVVGQVEDRLQATAFRVRRRHLDAMTVSMAA